MQYRHIPRAILLMMLALALSLALSGCSAGTATAAPTIGGGGGGHAGPASLYPNPALTPGDLFPGVTAKEVCVSGYSSSVRSVSSDEKAAVYQRYGIPNPAQGAPAGKHEVDHFISLELGGSNALTNLWPEPYVTPDGPNKIGAREKDKVENYLHAEVCAGRMPLPQAQDAIRTDWYAVYLRIAK